MPKRKASSTRESSKRKVTRPRIAEAHKNPPVQRSTILNLPATTDTPITARIQDGAEASRQTATATSDLVNSVLDVLQQRGFVSLQNNISTASPGSAVVVAGSDAHQPLNGAVASLLNSLGAGVEAGAKIPPTSHACRCETDCDCANAVHRFRNQIQSLLDGSLAESSKVTYARAFNKLTIFVNQYAPYSTVLPLSVPLLASFIAFCFSQHMASATITSMVSAISYIHKLAGFLDPTNNFIIKKLLQGVKKLNGQPDTRLPITPTILHALVKSLEFTCSGAYNRALLKTMYLTAFHALLRVGELTSNPQNGLHYKDCTIVPEGFLLSIRNFKFHHGKPPVTLLVSSQPDSLFCPVVAMLSYLKLRGTDPGMLFSFPACIPVTRSYFCNQLSQSLSWAGFDPKLYKSHSFRIGAATYAAMQGLSDQQIQAMGRWKSDAFKKYIRIPVLQGI